ncbi:TPA: ParB N-terminal domain-containing protein [Vibrio parahaemolyticus]|uniref:ParB N-terminal domain-containing protein n=1 Tax=Vibrio parahaemolyticus TaxID=670 RepID=UPI0004208573|nr:ParB N-terminal domain-containing protein [Vibrio parahaemolyticus]EJT0907340.1 ParB N-terminal domain-containing protein [Vibrio parahaemolyticus]ELA7934204.1 ParB N-terminal domain-containing protein [Vibrio parahaemolyticus]HCE3300253.1 ParB N-terminal domain-containing protein [Vibrio parahaemolyticus]HCE3304603.1 ParB N-terminal domain-containing protein [Vibrio parahaemolyticus]HCH5999900.1 ParB N-terminal domain-containing protein [Vibrio parahaemolyticus]
MMKHYTLEQIDPRQLVLDERFQSRQTQLIGNKADRAASINSRQRQLKNILTSIENGNGIREPIEAYEIYGELYVVSGFHRTEACHVFLKDNPSKVLSVPVTVYRGYTEAEAYLDSLTKNIEHGTALDQSEMWQNKFKQSLMQGENLKILSKRETAKLFDCSHSQGLHIVNAQKACAEVGLPSFKEWFSDYQKAAEKLRRRLMKRFEVTLCDFDKDGFPIISRLAKAYKGNKFEDDLSEEEIEQIEIFRQQSTLIELIKRNPIAFRKALNSLDKKSLGIVVKRKWDEDKVVLKYCEDNSTDDDMF